MFLFGYEYFTDVRYDVIYILFFLVEFFFAKVVGANTNQAYMSNSAFSAERDRCTNSSFQCRKLQLSK